MTSGLFITFEGGEGAGKSTQIKRLASWLVSLGHDVVVTREPGGSTAAEQIRGVLLDGSVQMDGITQALLFAAARRDHVRATIAPALARGAIVLCDRFIDSTRAYQGMAGNVPADVIEQLEKLAIGALMPDLTLILDAPPETGLARAAMRRGASQLEADRYESESLQFHKGVQMAFRQIAEDDPARCVLIDAAVSADEVFRSIRSQAERRLAPPRANV